MTEKLALEHELASLKPEVEHLRSQAASYQLALSEKLSLQRELNTVQVELESEKRANQKLLAKQIEEAEQDTKLEVQLGKLRKEWAKERQDHEQAARESERALESSEERKVALENKLEAMREKLRTTKAQLKETQVELQQARVAQEASKAQLKETQVELQQAKAAQEAASTQTVPLKDPEKPPRNPRKRKVAILPDTIGTPDEGTRKGRVTANQREKRVSTMPGDKSNFSITPFLNRTASLAPESPPNEQPHEQTKETLASSQGQEEEPATETNATPSAAPKKKRTKKTASATTTKSSGKAVLSGTVTGKENRKVSKAKAPVLSQVVEENEENEGPDNKESTSEGVTMENPAVKSTMTDSMVSEDPSRIKKKRKLLGGGPIKTLFDEEEGESARPALGKGLFGGGKGFPVLMSKGLGGAKGATGAAAFSPLKKDKKAAVAAAQ